MEEALSWVLRAGVVVSAVLIILGLSAMWVTGNTSNAFCVMKLDWMIGGSPFFEPSHILFLGFAVLILTPIIGVAVSTLFYLKTRDLPFTAITFILLLILIISITFGIR